MEKQEIADQSVEFIRQNLPKESLSAILPINEESIYDFIDSLESGIEVILTQEEEADGRIIDSIRKKAVDFIDELNLNPDNIDYDDLNRKLTQE